MLGHITRGAIMKLADQQRACLPGRMKYASWGWGTDALKYSGTSITHCFKCCESAKPVSFWESSLPQSLAKISLAGWLWFFQFCLLAERPGLKHKDLLTRIRTHIQQTYEAKSLLRGPFSQSKVTCLLQNLSPLFLTHWRRVTQICVFNTRLFSLHNTLNL